MGGDPWEPKGSRGRGTLGIPRDPIQREPAKGELWDRTSASSGGVGTRSSGVSTDPPVKLKRHKCQKCHFCCACAWSPETPEPSQTLCLANDLSWPWHHPPDARASHWTLVNEKWTSTFSHVQIFILSLPERAKALPGHPTKLTN